MPVFRTASEEETIALGAQLAQTFPPGATVLLIGNLGAGKTTLAKGIAKGLGAAPPEEVSSPTFTLIHEYGTPPAVYHVDLYRLDNPRDVATLGLDELFDSPAVVLIEWGERFPQLMPPGHIQIHLRTLDTDEREIRVTPRIKTMQLEPPRGMRDFYPEDLEVRDRIFSAWSEASTLHGFQRFEPPVVESFELLARKAGEEVAQQIYHFEDKSNRQLALRPEVTPSLVRMISARGQQIVFPAKWWTIGQCFRYERMTRGRKREHFQWNLDVVGEPSVQAEAWILATITSALRALGLGPADVRIHINNRQVVAFLLAEMGVPQENHVDVFMVLDKKGKVPLETLIGMLVEKGLQPDAAADVMNLLGSERSDSLSSGPLAASPATEDVRRLLDLADAMGFADYLKFDSGIVRGLSYYTGTVFEGFDAARQLRAIFGGGRYDNLFGDMTGVSRPAVGMGFGDVVIAELLADLKRLPPTKPHVDVCVGMFDSLLSREASQVAARLVASGIQTDLAFTAAKPGKFFGYADKRGARFTVFLAPDELREGAVAVKEMISGEKATVAINDLAEWLRAKLTAV